MPANLRRPLKIMLVTDVFPPGSGGSGWSTFYLGKALAARGHAVQVLRPRYVEVVAHPTRRIVQYEGMHIVELLVPPPPAWAARAGVGKVLSEQRAVRLLARYAYEAARRGEADVLHGQHAVSATAASVAARKARAHGVSVVSIATVRDYWPLCPASTRLFMAKHGDTFECKDCHILSSYLACASQRGDKLALFPALARWLQTWRASRVLAQCDAVVAVSHYVQGELARSKRVPTNKLHVIPNLVDLPSVERALSGPWPLADISQQHPYLLFVGKWDTNKGAQMLPDAVARSGVTLPVVLAGDGPLRPQIETEARSLGLDFRFHTWLDNDSVLKLMRHATALLFPSAWQEPLSRVLLEGCATGAAIVALDTGGTGDIITHCRSGWLAENMVSFVAGIRRVTGDPQFNAMLRAGARLRAEERFTAPIVSAEVEALYISLLERQEHK